MKKYVKKGVAFIGMRHLYRGMRHLFWKKTLYLHHEINIRNHTTDRISPDYRRGVCTHVRYHLRICHVTWVQNVSWGTSEGSHQLSWFLQTGTVLYLSISGFDIHHAVKPPVFPGVNFGNKQTNINNKYNIKLWKKLPINSMCRMSAVWTMGG